MDFFGRAYAKHKINLTWPYYCDTFQSVCHSGISEKLPTIRLAVTSKLLKQSSKWTIIIAIVIYQQLAVLKFSCKTENMRIENKVISLINVLVCTLSKSLSKLVLLLSLINKVKPSARSTTAVY